MEMNESKSGDSSLRDWFSKSRSSDGTPGWVQLGGKYAGKPCAKQPGQTTKPKCGSSKMKRNLDKDEEQAAFRRKQEEDPNPDRKGKAINVATEETVIEKAGEKDACYKKVKSRYSVWPSAYASGALVKCRKVGAANWGNKTKKEDYDYSNWRDDFKALEIETIDLIKPDPLLQEEKKCPDGKYWCFTDKKCKKIPAGYHVMGGGRLMKDEDHEDDEKNGNGNGNGNGGDVSEAKCEVKVKKEKPEYLTANQRKFNIATVHPANEETDRQLDAIKDAVSRLKEKRDVNENILNIFNRKDASKVRQGTYHKDKDVKKGTIFSNLSKRNEMLKQLRNSHEVEGTVVEDWQKVNKSDKTDGMSKKAVAAYRRENPGSKLKTAVTGDPKPGSKDANRRKSFCSRSKGQQDMHNIDCSKTPDKAICKARRRWKC